MFERILKYCDDNMDVNVCQEPYKKDLFKLFEEAYRGGLCSTPLRITKDGRVVRGTPKKPQVSGDTIREFAKTSGWLKGDRRRKKAQLATVTAWWDEWAYAWDKNPPKRKYTRQKKAAPTDRPS